MASRVIKRDNFPGMAGLRCLFNISRSVIRLFYALENYQIISGGQRPSGWLSGPTLLLKKLSYSRGRGQVPGGGALFLHLSEERIVRS